MIFEMNEWIKEKRVVKKENCEKDNTSLLNECIINLIQNYNM